MAKKSVTKKQTTAISQDINKQLVADSQKQSGFETMSGDDLAIPFLAILQALSPQVRGATKIKGAAEGKIFNTVSEELFDSIKIIPCAYQKKYVEWVTREKGGGFVQQHDDTRILTQCKRDDRNRNMLPNGNQIVDTAYYYCLHIKDKKSIPERVVIAMFSTQLKKSRKWNSKMRSIIVDVDGKHINPPIYSHIYTLTTEEETKDDNTWSGWKISDPALIDNIDLYTLAKTLNEDVQKDLVKISAPPIEQPSVNVDMAASEKII